MRPCQLRNTIDEDLNILTSRGTKYFYQFVIRVPFALGERLKSFWIPFSKIQLILVHYGIVRSTMIVVWIGLSSHILFFIQALWKAWDLVLTALWMAQIAAQLLAGLSCSQLLKVIPISPGKRIFVGLLVFECFYLVMVTLISEPSSSNLLVLKVFGIISVPVFWHIIWSPSQVAKTFSKQQYCICCFFELKRAV